MPRQAGPAGALVQSAAIGASVQRWLRTDRPWTTFNRTMSALLAGSIVLFVW